MVFGSLKALNGSSRSNLNCRYSKTCMFRTLEPIQHVHFMHPAWTSTWNMHPYITFGVKSQLNTVFSLVHTKLNTVFSWLTKRKKHETYEGYKNTIYTATTKAMKRSLTAMIIQRRPIKKKYIKITPTTMTTKGTKRSVTPTTMTVQRVPKHLLHRPQWLYKGYKNICYTDHNDCTKATQTWTCWNPRLHASHVVREIGQQATTTGTKPGPLSPPASDRQKQNQVCLFH